MKKVGNKISLFIIFLLVMSLFVGTVPAQAAVKWMFSASNGKKETAVNGTITLKKQEFCDMNLYRNGQLIKDNDTVYKVSWYSSDKNIVFVDKQNGKLRADKFGKMSEDTAKAKITAVIKNKKTGSTTKKSFTVKVLGESAEKKETGTRTEEVTSETLRTLRQEEEKLAEKVECLQKECQETEQEINRIDESRRSYVKQREEELIQEETALLEEIQGSVFYIYSRYYTEIAKEKYDIPSIEDTLTEEVISTLIGNEYVAEAMIIVRRGVKEGKEIDGILNDIEAGLGSVVAKQLGAAFIDGIFGSGVSTVIEFISSGWSSEEQIQYQFNKVTELKEGELACFDELFRAEQIDVALLEETMLKAEELYLILKEAGTHGGKDAGANIWYEVWQKLKDAYQQCILLEMERELFAENDLLDKETGESATGATIDSGSKMTQTDETAKLSEQEKLSASINKLREAESVLTQQRDALALALKERKPATWTELTKYKKKLNELGSLIAELEGLNLGAIKTLTDYAGTEAGALQSGIIDKLGGLFGSVVAGGMKETDYHYIDALAEFNGEVKPYILSAQLKAGALRVYQIRITILSQLANASAQGENEQYFTLKLLEKEISELEEALQRGRKDDVLKLAELVVIGDMLTNAYQGVLSENDDNRQALLALENRVQSSEAFMRLNCTEEEVNAAINAVYADKGVELIDLYTKLFLKFHGFDHYFTGKERKLQSVFVPWIGSCRVYGCLDKQNGTASYVFFMEQDPGENQLAAYCFDRDGNLYSIVDGEGRILVYLDGANILKSNVDNPEAYVNAAFWLYQNFEKTNFNKEYRTISMFY